MTLRGLSLSQMPLLISLLVWVLVLAMVMSLIIDHVDQWCSGILITGIITFCFLDSVTTHSTSYMPFRHLWLCIFILFSLSYMYYVLLLAALHIGTITFVQFWYVQPYMVYIWYFFGCFVSNALEWWIIIFKCLFSLKFKYLMCFLVNLVIKIKSAESESESEF